VSEWGSLIRRRHVADRGDAGRAPVQRRAGIASPGRPLEPGTRALMERHVRAASGPSSFAAVRIHDDAGAAQAARALDARAYAVGNDLVFGSGEYGPGRPEGRRLLAHELAHFVQQDGGGPTGSGIEETLELEREASTAAWAVDAGRPVKVTGQARGGIQRQRIGTAVKHPKGAPSPMKKAEATFDGATFVLMGDGKGIMRVPAQSGRPIGVRPADAKACGGSTSDSYLNNPRYVGIKDNGPIPEGEYQFRYEQIATFSASEQMQMTLGGHYTDPFGAGLHGGDWGSGRVALNPVRILPGKKGCGDTKTRSGFFLHGGVLPGSSGCIDIGNAGMDSVVKLLAGFRGRIVVKVAYTQPAPSVGGVQRAVGRFTYPSQGGQDPSIVDRLKSVFGGDSEG
jgi:hypothetical protein